MPTERLSMRKIKEVLRLFYDKRISQRAIAGACGIARSTVYFGEHNLRVPGSGLAKHGRKLLPAAGRIPGVP